MARFTGRLTDVHGVSVSRALSAVLSAMFILLGSSAFAGSDAVASGAANVSARDIGVTTSWWALRGRGMVVQTEDRTCGAASLATLLQLQTGRRWTEKEILGLLPDRTRVSLADLESVARKLNFRTRIASVNWETLVRAKSPVLLYFKSEDPSQVGHFVVLSGVNQTHALVLDPSWGRKTYSAAQLLARWELPEQNSNRGYILAVLPKGNGSRSAMMECDIANRTHAASVAAEATGISLRSLAPKLFGPDDDYAEKHSSCR